MFVGIARIELHLPTVTSLKGKRSVVQSVLSRLRNEFRLAAAEVDHLDQHQITTIGIAVVSNEASHAQQMLRRALQQVEESRLDAEVIATELDVFPAFD